MADDIGGVRDHLANERTQLAWLRTGSAVMVVGLAVARFADDGQVTATSLVAGLLLVVAGAGATVYGTVRYRRLAAELRRGTAESASSSTGPALTAMLLLLTVLIAAVVLLVGA